jgi:hypothetical protein
VVKEDPKDQGKIVILKYRREVKREVREAIMAI